MFSKRNLRSILLAVFLILSACVPLGTPFTANPHPNQLLSEPTSPPLSLSTSTPTAAALTDLPPTATVLPTETVALSTRTATAVPRATPTSGEYLTTRNVNYTHINGVNPSLLSLDIYYTEPLTANRPVVLYIHGGGWASGDKSHVSAKPDYFTRAGYVFISANYRLSPAAAFPAHARDVASAIAWTSKSIQLYGGDPNQIYLMGYSAGGHLVTLVAANEKYINEAGLSLSTIKGVVSLDTAAYDLSDFASRCKNRILPEPYSIPFGQDQAEWKLASPVTYIQPGKNIPPMALVYSGDSGIGSTALREQLATDFSKKLNAAGVPYELFGDNGKSHNQINDIFGQTGDTIAPKVLAFLKKIQANLK